MYMCMCLQVKQNEKGVYQPMILMALVKAFGPMYLSGSLLKLLHDILIFLNPVILG